jgi:hypothetical protein
MILERTTEALHETLALLRSIQSALATDETGEGLVEVARNSHRAEMELAAQQHADALDKCDGQVQVECIRAVIAVMRDPRNRFGAIKCGSRSADVLYRFVDAFGTVAHCGE